MKLVKALKAVATGNRQYIADPLHTISYRAESTPETIYPVKFAKEYSIVVTIGTSQWIDEEMIISSDGMIIEHAVENMKHVIFNHVYGEIYRDLIDLKFEMRNELRYRESASIKKLEQIMEKITL